MIDDVEFARALHVLCIAHWIGGVAFVTLIALPFARAQKDAAAGWALFEGIENRFAGQVRWSIPFAGASGFWMTWRLGLWAAFADPAFWWMDAMVLRAGGAHGGGQFSSLNRLPIEASPLRRRAIRGVCCAASGARISCCSWRQPPRSSAPWRAPTEDYCDEGSRAREARSRGNARRTPRRVARPPRSGAGGAPRSSVMASAPSFSAPASGRS